jgi:hypothetical protein
VRCRLNEHIEKRREDDQVELLVLESTVDFSSASSTREVLPPAPGIPSHPLACSRLQPHCSEANCTASPRTEPTTQPTHAAQYSSTINSIREMIADGLVSQ